MRRASSLVSGSATVLLLLWTATPLASQTRASDELRFDLLYESLVAASNRYNGNVMGTVTLLVLAIGWIISSEQSRECFKQSVLAYRAVLCSILAVFCIHIILSFGTLRVRQLAIAELMELNYVEPRYFLGAQVALAEVLGNLALTTALFVALFMLVFSVRTV